MSRVLVVDHEPPQASRDGGAARMVSILGLLRDEGHSVVFASLRPWPSDLIATRRRLAEMGVDIAAPIASLETWLPEHHRAFDAVIASRLRVAEVMLPLARRHWPAARFIYDATHVEHLAKFRLAKLTGSRPVLVAALRDRSAERAIVAAADAVMVTSEDDADALRLLMARKDIRVVPAVDLDHAVGHPCATRSGIAFLGFLGTYENQDAVHRLVHGVWPLVEAEIGPTRLTVIGAAAPNWLRDAATKSPGLSVTGHLPHIGHVLNSAAVMTIPLRGGAGLKTKVLQAFAHHLPVVATADGVRGVPVVDGVHALTAESDAELATATARIIGNPALAGKLTNQAARLLQRRFDPAVSRVSLREALEIR